MIRTAARSIRNHARTGGGGAATAARGCRRRGGAVRYLNVLEYISMELMKTYGVRTPECYVASTADEAQHLFSNSLNKREYLIIVIYRIAFVVALRLIWLVDAI